MQKARVPRHAKLTCKITRLGVTTTYHQALDRAITVQAFARGWRERLVIQKLQRRKRAFWGTCLWTFRTMRFYLRCS